MTKPFLDILYNLSHEVGLKLYPDSHEACKLIVGNQTHVQLEMDFSQEKLLLACVIVEIPLGKFRENVLKHAFVANAAPYPCYGCLCYIQKLNALALYETLPIKNLTGDYLMNYIIMFTQKAELWKKAIDSGKPGPNILQGSKPSLPPQFGSSR